MKKKIIIVGIIVVLMIAIFPFLKPDKIDETSNTANVFQINEILIYCGASGEKFSDNYQNPEWNLNIYQYADIALYLERVDEFSNENNIKELYIDNIKLNSPRLGTPGLYYLNPYDFGTDKIPYSDSIKESLEFNIVNSNNEKNDMSYSIPIAFQDLSNPITLKYVNKDILKEFKIDNTEKLIFGGEILKRARINPEDIKNTISFRINIKTGDNEIISSSIEIPIPQEGENGESLYDGNIKYKMKDLKIYM